MAISLVPSLKDNSLWFTVAIWYGEKTEVGIAGLLLVVLRGAPTTFLFHRQVPDSLPVPVTLASDLKMGERMRYPCVAVVSPGAIWNHTAAVFPDR